MGAVPKFVFLIGLPGAGKTTIGRELSTRLQLPFIDLDDEIVKREGTSIKDIFEKKGEDYFRKCEATCLHALIERKEVAIVSVGGGTPCFYDNMAKMQGAGKTCYLKVSWQALASRASVQNGVRPLFKNLPSENLAKSLKERFSWRLPFYAQADIIVETDTLAPPQIVAAILSSL